MQDEAELKVNSEKKKFQVYSFSKSFISQMLLPRHAKCYYLEIFQNTMVNLMV